MLSIPRQIKIFLCVESTDMRKGFDTLAGVVRDTLRLDPLSGHLFVFRGRRSDRVKLLWWDTDGWALFYKRLEAGKFTFPAAREGQTSISIPAADLASVRRGQRWVQPA